MSIVGVLDTERITHFMSDLLGQQALLIRAKRANVFLGSLYLIADIIKIQEIHMRKLVRLYLWVSSLLSHYVL